MSKNNRLLFLLIGMAFLISITGCISNIGITDNIAMARIPIEMYCCQKYNLSYESSQNYTSCCLSTESPDECNTCITEENIRAAEYSKKQRQKYLINIISLLILFSLTVISLLLLIANKITSLVKDSADGFLKPKLKKIITKLFTIISAATFFFILYIILTSGILKLGAV